MRYFRLPWMTRRQAIGLWWYNNVRRHWSNWRIRRMWRADPHRPSICFKAGALGPEAMTWAHSAVARIEARKGEDVDKWAERLAGDLSKFKD